MRVPKKQAAAALGLVAFTAALIAFLTAGGAGAQQDSALALPRSQTFYMSGNQWSPNNDLNPAKTWDYITGLVGFAYETPFRYDPLKDHFTPWLASAGRWSSKTTYVMTVRNGVKWSDGKSMTVQDFLYSFNILKIPTHAQNPLWRDTGLKSITAKGNALVFKFGAKPGYQQFDFYRFNVVIVPKHVFSRFSKTDLASGNLQKPIVGTGPYLYQSGIGTQSQTVVWKKNGKWWAIKALGIHVAPNYVVDIENGTNAAALANFVAGNIDLFNNFAPKAAIKGSAKTYFSKAPYHLGANTTWLFPNTTRKPLDDKQFRRALAFSINMKQIIDKAYQGLVQKASPTGLLPIWNKWVSGSLVSKYGFSYNLGKAKSILAAAGYRDTNGDGYVENKDGSKIDLQIVCPNGWSDWMTAIQVIADSAKAAGIKVTSGYPEYATMADDRGHARFDLLLGNDRQYSNTPWTYYQYIYRLPILNNQTSMNYERINSPKGWNLTKGLDKIPTTNAKAFKVQMASLQKVFMQDLPAIPLWYNGMWAMFNTKHWKNWPSSSARQYTPSSWRNYWQMTSIDMLTHLRPA
ncbi:MAG: ABC transporter substrate-binding protein [Gaiellaceae bacterium]